MSVRVKLLLCYLLAAVVALSTHAVALLFLNPMLVIVLLISTLCTLFLTAYLDFPKKSKLKKRPG